MGLMLQRGDDECATLLSSTRERGPKERSIILPSYVVMADEWDDAMTAEVLGRNILTRNLRPSQWSLILTATWGTDKLFSQLPNGAAEQDEKHVG